MFAVPLVTNVGVSLRVPLFPPLSGCNPPPKEGFQKPEPTKPSAACAANAGCRRLLAGLIPRYPPGGVRYPPGGVCYPLRPEDEINSNFNNLCAGKILFPCRTFSSTGGGGAVLVGERHRRPAALHYVLLSGTFDSREAFIIEK